MVFGEKLDKVIRCLGNELNLEFYAWNEKTKSYDIQKQKLEEGVRMVRIVGNDTMIKLVKYNDGTEKIGLILGHKVCKCDSQVEMAKVVLNYAIDNMNFSDRLLLYIL